MLTKNKKSQQNQTLAELRASVALAQFEYFLAYQARIALIDQQKADENGEKQKIHIQPPLMIAATVGVGKSYAVTSIIQNAHTSGHPTLILVNTKKLAKEYVARLRAAGIPAELYKPREAPAEDGSTTPHTCFKLKEVNEAGEKHHRPAQSICRECEHGMKVAYDSDSKERIEAAVRFFTKKQMGDALIAAVRSCRFLYEGLPAQMREMHIVATHAAFSDGLAVYRDEFEGKERFTQRLIFIDESFPLTESIEINPHSIETWMTSIDSTLEAVERGYFRDSDAGAEKIKEALTLAKIAFKNTVNVLLSDKKRKPGELKDVVGAAVKALNDAELTAGGTAIFEKITSNLASEFFIPLRALTAFNTALKNGSARVEAGRKIHVEAISPLFNHVVKKGSVILLDATPSTTIQMAVINAGGQVMNAHIAQNIIVKHYGQKMFTRGNPKLDNYSGTAEKALSDLIAFASQVHRDNPCSILTHKAYLQHAIYDNDAAATAELFTEKTGHKIGWFGAHDRGHNEYAGDDLIIGGMVILDALAVAKLWHKHATILNQIGMEVDFNLSEKDPRHTYYVPKNQTQRAFLMQYYAANLVQAIGRARGINAETALHIHILGGIPEVLEYLKEYKIEVEIGGVYTSATRKNSPINDIISTAANMVKQGAELYKLTIDQLQAACQAGVSRLKHRREIVARILRELKTHGFSFFKAALKRPPRLRLRAAPAPTPKPAPTAPAAKPFNPDWMFEPGIDQALLSTL